MKNLVCMVTWCKFGLCERQTRQVAHRWQRVTEVDLSCCKQTSLSVKLSMSNAAAFLVPICEQTLHIGLASRTKGGRAGEE